MILVTGGTGFIGRILVSHLVTLGYPVRLLLNPSRDYPKLPRGVSVEVAISSMNDERNLRASMKDIDTVFHLVGTEWKGIHAEFEEVDIRAARMFSKVAKGMGVPSCEEVTLPVTLLCANNELHDSSVSAMITMNSSSIGIVTAENFPFFISISVTPPS